MTSLEDTLRVIIREELRDALGSLRGSNAKALTRRQAEKALSLGRTKLQELIASGALKTVRDNPRLIPASEVEKYAQPRRQKPRRRVPAHRPVADDVQSAEVVREALRRGGR